MDFNKELSVAYHFQNIGKEEIDILGYNCWPQTFQKLQDFLETDYKKILTYEKKQSHLFYEIRYKALEDVSIKEFLLVKWNKLWRKKQTTT